MSLKLVSERKSKLVFMLWGGYAKKEGKTNILKIKHFILKTGHPSPLSANRGYLVWK
jgi:uracil-DNA glycosylase